LDAMRLAISCAWNPILAAHINYAFICKHSARPCEVINFMQMPRLLLQPIACYCMLSYLLLITQPRSSACRLLAQLSFDQLMSGLNLLRFHPRRFTDFWG